MGGFGKNSGDFGEKCRKNGDYARMKVARKGLNIYSIKIPCQTFARQGIFKLFYNK
jgi:hypothetical protein